MCDENPPDDWFTEPWAHLENWPEEDRENVWNHLVLGWESIFSELGFSNKDEFKEVIVTLQATVRVASDSNVEQALSAAKTSLKKAGEVTSISTTIEAGSAELGIDRSEGWRMLSKKIDSSLGAAEKGLALERLMATLFNSIPGFEVKNNIRTSTEEIDLWVTNASQDGPFIKEKLLILVECKNWSRKVGKDEFVLFRQKMINRGHRCSLGFLVSWNGFASTVYDEQLRGSQGEHLVGLLDRTIIETSVESGDFYSGLVNAVYSALKI